jgi:16S rRNA (cytosine967-C5)-methyltransferase
VPARVTRSRVAALEVMRRARAGELADRAFDAVAASLDARDRAWTQELVYGTLRLRGRLDHLLAALVRGGTDALEPDVLDVLRLAAYQLLEMGSVPTYAAISQAQELARAAGAGRAARLVGGVLHALQRKHSGIPFPDFGREPIAFLASWGSHPRWLVERWIRRWGPADARALVEANNLRPELYLRPLHLARDSAVERLRQAGIGAQPVPFSATSLKVLPPATALAALGVIPAVVQDPAASLVVEYAAVPNGARVLDLCAAPGGKALGMAEGASFVAAADLSWRRLERLRENLGRLGGLEHLGVVVADGRVPPFRPAHADLVLLDAPCTGSGTLRRHPDGRWRLREEHLPDLVALQAAMLQSAASLVRPGGWLLYSTCSLEEEENELQVDAFLASQPEWEIDPPAGGMPADLLDGMGRLCMLPQRHGVDGSFAARLRRRA